MDRADAAGLGVAVALHGGLLALLALGLFQPAMIAPPADPFEVSFVEEVALDSASPAPSQPAPPSAGETLGPPEEAAPAPEPLPAPIPEPLPPVPAPPVPAPRAAAPAPAPKARPTPQPARAAPQPRPAPAKAQPSPARDTSNRRRPEEARGRAAASRGSRLADLDLSGLGRDKAAVPRPSPAPAATMNAQASASIAQAIARQVQPCADRQVYPGPGAERIVTTLNLRLNRDGSLARPPSLVRQSGTDDENGRYAQRVADLAIRSFVECAPLRGLPAALYDVPRGWSNFTMNYRMPG